MRTLDLKLRIWRQAGPGASGRMVDYDVPGVSEDMSFLEMLDLLNERLVSQGQEPVAFEHDCREGICGSCGLMINGQAHGPQLGGGALVTSSRIIGTGRVPVAFVAVPEAGCPSSAGPTGCRRGSVGPVISSGIPDAWVAGTAGRTSGDRVDGGFPTGSGREKP